MVTSVEEAISSETIENYQRDGVVVLRDVFTDWIDILRKGAKFNLQNPSDRAITHKEDTHEGKFFEDFCSWERIPEYKDFVMNSPLGEVAGRLMASPSAQFFHDHYLDKEASTGVTTPWHQDIPYYFVKGMQTVSIWIPLDHRKKEVSLRCAAGSHTLDKEIRPTSWSTNESFYDDDSAFMDMPDINSGVYKIKEWEMNLGDAVAFNFKTIHGANPNLLGTPSRTISFRLMGDDAYYFQRPGRTSPNYPGINQKTGEKLREDWFPIIWRS